MGVLRLTDPVQYLRGVGPARAEVLARLGVRTVGDLLFHFPRDLAYQPARAPIRSCRGKAGQTVTVGGVLAGCRWSGRPWKPIFSARLTDQSGWLEVVWFNAGWLKDQLGEGTRLVATGKLRPGPRGVQLANPKFSVVQGECDRAEPGERWEPVYPASAEISSGQIRQILRRNLARMLRLVDDFFSPEYLRRRELVGRRLAVGWLHFPTMDPSRPRQAMQAGQAQAGRDSQDVQPDEEAIVLQDGLEAEEVVARLKAARRRLAWDEALLFQLGLALRRQMRRSLLKATPLPCDERIRQRIMRRFPFRLTAAQERAIRQIAEDLAQPAPMNRLLQGDVGSGKTVVALFAALLAVAHGQQAAMMAPTEILAGQHFERISRYLAGSRVRWALLTGSASARERKQIHDALADGELDLVVGTTALLSEGVRFARLAVAVIDEQHKFGVYQRSDLRDKGQAANLGLRIAESGLGTPGTCGSGLGFRPEIQNLPAPHVLVMTATPIPRSLALTVFGDLAVSVLDELPPGRGRIDTRVVQPGNRERALDFIASRLAQGGQAYIVCPRIGPDQDALEQGDEPVEPDSAMLAAEQAYRELSGRFAAFGVTLVHGRMDRRRQHQALSEFASGRVRVLVATTVVEVGVDVARANVMAVLGAERFGLAQLHQLRGRIGRSADVPRSYCLLFVGAEGEPAGRLAILEQTRDGFRIAEEDLARRGPGQFFGPAQHGLPEFRHLDLAADLELLRQARDDAFAIIEQDPALSAPGHQIIRRHLLATYGRLLGLLDAG